MTSTDVEQLSCQELVELVTAYLEGALPETEHARFEEHLAACGNCQLYLEQMRTTIAVAGRLREEDVPPELEERLLVAFRDWRA